MVDDSTFAGLPLLGEGRAWRLYRDGARVVVVRFTGNLDDEQSAQWRARAQRTFDEDGWPRFGIVAPTEGTATTSLASRMKTAAFLRLAAKNSERVFIFTNAESSFVIRTILRTAGARNVELVEDSKASDVIAACRNG